MKPTPEQIRQIPLVAFVIAALTFYIVIIQANKFTDSDQLMKIFDIKNPLAAQWLYAWAYTPPLYSLFMYVSNYGFDDSDQSLWKNEVLYLINMSGVSLVLLVLGSAVGKVIITGISFVVLIAGFAAGGIFGALGGILVMAGIGLAASFAPYVCVVAMIGHALFLTPHFLKGWSFSFFAHEAEVIADELPAKMRYQRLLRQLQINGVC